MHQSLRHKSKLTLPLTNDLIPINLKLCIISKYPGISWFYTGRTFDLQLPGVLGFGLRRFGGNFGFSGLGSSFSGS